MTDDAQIPNAIAERMARSAQGRALGLELVSASPALILKVPYRPELVGDPDSGVIAGGVVTTLLDFACGWATALALDEPTSIATLDLRIDYMRPSRPGLDIHATAYCYKLTRSVAFLRGVAYDEDPSDPVAAAQAAFMLDSNAGRGPGANHEPPRPPPQRPS